MLSMLIEQNKLNSVNSKISVMIAFFLDSCLEAELELLKEISQKSQ